MTSPIPIYPVLRKSKWFLAFYVLLLLVGCFFISNFPKDITFFWINVHHHPVADVVFRYFTFLGDGIFYAALIVFFLVRSRWNGLIGFWSFAASSLVTQVIKNLVYPGTLRPKAFFEDSPLLHIVDGVTVHSLGSFPSGHTTTAFSIALWLSYITPNKKLSLLYVLLAAAVGYSRVYLAQHFLEDVIAGSFIGVFTTLVVIILMQRFRKRDKA